ncbi:hypothetical protein EGCR1_06215 [Enterococcus gilvus]|jgi:hypothetical protein|uniref:hypothetical protein n=1 Tax=Enterococcus gilvus TaxID=160453 RepID=UPI000DF60A45|nr:hypothetical protein [Enterococcus gilvus]AXG38330.1 hypothetical protein EGCR1_06215 [Enterococcus gilvus]
MDLRYVKIMSSCLLIVGMIFALPLSSLEIPLAILVFFIGMILFAIKPKPQPVRVHRKDRWM